MVSHFDKPMTRENTLLCVFSFNMGRSLATCLASISKMCAGFPVAIADDNSDDPKTVKILDAFARESAFVKFHISTESKVGKRHGNLYANIQAMTDFAIGAGYDYLFMVQDDMQFVRPLDDDILKQYSALLAAENVLQVDPRFLRSAGAYEIRPDLNCYVYPKTDARRSYADVGILKLSALRERDWRFRDSEPLNKKALTDMGFVRAFPFTPVIMHVPFPRTYRAGLAATKLMPPSRGSYCYHDMTKEERDRMDSRPLATLPHFRKFLRPKNMLLARLFYALKSDAAVFR